jgi:NADH-quinone oxidoreductase subunit H
MGKDSFEITLNGLKLIAIFLLMVQAVPLLVWLERRGSAFIQNRFGPNRVGPLGLLQLLADLIKFLFKEEFVPKNAIKPLFYIAPVIALVPAALAFAAIPIGAPIRLQPFELFGSTWGPYEVLFQGYDINVGIIFVLGVSSLAAYPILLAGWGSGSKYTLLGALRASSQIISYELALGLSIVGVILLHGSFSFTDMIASQAGPLSFSVFGHQVTGPSWLPNWGIFYQPLAAILFFSATFAETNRLPFDLPEGEAELVAGFHTEYGGLKMNLFFIGEYGHMLVASALMVTFFFGGYLIPGITPDEMLLVMQGFFGQGNLASILNGLLHHVVFMLKISIFLWIFVQVRWTLPRFRYDQLMDLGWKKMLPWALANTVLTAVVIVMVA